MNRSSDKEFKNHLKNLFLSFDEYGYIVLPKNEYAAIKKVFRTNATLVEDAYEVCLAHMARRDSRVRYRCLLFLREIISRSAKSRDRIEADFDDIVEKCILGDGSDSQLVKSGLPQKSTSATKTRTKRSVRTSKFLQVRLLPEPASVAVDLRELGLRTVEEWKDVYGALHPKFVVGYNYLRNSLHLKFPDIRASNIRQGIEREERKQFAQRILQAKYQRILDEIDTNLRDIVVTLKEASEIFLILVPDFETMFQNALQDPSYNPEDIYEYIRKTSGISEQQASLQENGDQADALLNSSATDSPGLEPSSLENSSIDLSASELFAKDSISEGDKLSSDDGLEEEDDSAKRLGTQNIENLLKSGMEKEKRRSNIFASESLEDAPSLGSPDPIPHNRDSQKNENESIEKNTSTSSAEDDEWEDVEEDSQEYDLSEFEDILSYSSSSSKNRIVNRDIVITLKTTMDELKNKENSEIFDSLEERMKDIMTRYKPMIDEWYSIVSRVEVDDRERRRHERLQLTIIDLRSSLDKLVKKCERIKMNINFAPSNEFDISRRAPDVEFRKRKREEEDDRRLTVARTSIPHQVLHRSVDGLRVNKNPKII